MSDCVGECGEDVLRATPGCGESKCGACHHYEWDCRCAYADSTPPTTKAPHDSPSHRLECNLNERG